MNSNSALGATQITLQFNLEKDIDAAAQDVQTAISKTLRLLPSEMTTPPSFRKVNPADMPIIYLALSSPALPLSTVSEYADTMMAQRISMINGLPRCRSSGCRKGL
jgi:HAE1 family hydrophobic/amphiphilic exporter-1